METETNKFIDVVEVVLVTQHVVYKAIGREIVKAPRVETVRICLSEESLRHLIKYLQDTSAEIENSKNETPC